MHSLRAHTHHDFIKSPTYLLSIYKIHITPVRWLSGDRGSCRCCCCCCFFLLSCMWHRKNNQAMSNAKHAINDFSEFCFALWKYLKSLLACPSRCSKKKLGSIVCFGDRGYIYRKMWIYFVLFCHSLSLSFTIAHTLPCVCKRSTFLHHFMSGRISCRFFLFECERSPLPMFSCRLPNNKCVFFFFLVRREPLRAGKKMFDINAC